VLEERPAPLERLESGDIQLHAHALGDHVIRTRVNGLHDVVHRGLVDHNDDRGRDAKASQLSAESDAPFRAVHGAIDDDGIVQAIERERVGNDRFEGHIDPHALPEPLHERHARMTQPLDDEDPELSDTVPACAGVIFRA
jgi:hypothetical protein